MQLCLISVKSVQIAISVVLIVLAIRHLIRYFTIKDLRFKKSESEDELIMAAADFFISVCNVLLVILLRI